MGLFFGEFMKIYAAFLLLALSFQASAKLLDKIVAVFNNEVITLSDIKRIKVNLKSRKSIARGVYLDKNYDLNELIEVEIDLKTIRAHLTTIGYLVNDDQVEQLISSLEKNNGINREGLIKFLKSENVTFNEYFELLRASREHGILMNIVIEPLVSITEQQIKNEFFRQNISNKNLDIRYNLVAYSINKDSYKSDEHFTEALKQYLSTGVIPKDYKNLEEISIGEIAQNDLDKNLSRTLKSTDEGTFSKTIRNGSNYISYYVRKKDLIESSLYQQAKPRIRAKLFEIEARKILEVWLRRERDKHFIRKF